MPHRDPETGQFVAGAGGRDGHDYDELEQVTARRNFVIPASELDGSTSSDYGQDTTFDGVELYDVDRVADRRDIAVLLWARHTLIATSIASQTADGTARVSVEVSTNPKQALPHKLDESDVDVADQSGDMTVEVEGKDVSETVDLVGPPLQAYGFSSFTGGGGGGSSMTEGPSWEGPVVADPTFDARDSLFVNGAVQAQNIDDGAVQYEVQVQHLWGISRDL